MQQPMVEFPVLAIGSEVCCCLPTMTQADAVERQSGQTRRVRPLLSEVVADYDCEVEFRLKLVAEIVAAARKAVLDLAVDFRAEGDIPGSLDKRRSKGEQNF